MPAGHKEMGKIILPISVDEYYNMFHSDNAPYSFEKYFIYRGYGKIQITQNWSENFPEPVLKSCWGKPSISQKIIAYEVDVKGNPFVKLTPTTKNYVLCTKEKNLIQMRLWTELKNVPYSDCFNNEEQYTIVSMPMKSLNASGGEQHTSHKVAYRVSSQVVFKKSVSLFKSKIEKACLEKGIESYKNWTDWASIKIEDYR